MSEPIHGTVVARGVEYRYEASWSEGTSPVQWSARLFFQDGNAVFDGELHDGIPAPELEAAVRRAVELQAHRWEGLL